MPGPMGSEIAPPLNAMAAQAQAQAQQQAQQAAAAAKRAKNRAKRPTDKNMPEGVEDVIIGDGSQRYRDLREVERRLDATMMRKRADIMESVNRNIKVCLARLED